MTHDERLRLVRLRTRLLTSLSVRASTNPAWIVHLLHAALVDVERILAQKAPRESECRLAISRAEAALGAFGPRTEADRAHTVLIVDDDADICRTFSQILEEEGYSTMAARSGADALWLLHERQRPCVVLLDLMMPVVDGWEVLGRLGACDDLAEIPIVVISAFAEHAPTDTRISAVLKKPIEADALIDTVARFCKAA